MITMSESESIFCFNINHCLDYRLWVTSTRLQNETKNYIQIYSKILTGESKQCESEVPIVEWVFLHVNT